MSLKTNKLKLHCEFLPILKILRTKMFFYSIKIASHPNPPPSPFHHPHHHLPSPNSTCRFCHRQQTCPSSPNLVSFVILTKSNYLISVCKLCPLNSRCIDHIEIVQMLGNALYCHLCEQLSV